MYLIFGYHLLLTMLCLVVANVIIGHMCNVQGMYGHLVVICPILFVCFTIELVTIMMGESQCDFIFK